MGARETFFQTEAQGVDAPWAPSILTFGEITMRDEKLKGQVGGGQVPGLLPTPSRTRDLTGMTFGRLEVLGFAGRKKTVYRWLCRCSCGVEKAICTANLTSGDTKSCGCLFKETAGLHGVTHGASYEPLFSLWKTMVRRCSVPAAASYKHYGGRGIVVSEEFSDYFRFKAYIEAELGPKPTPKHQLDRIDNSKGYEAGNLRWASAREQALNRRTTKNIVFNGTLTPVKDACRATGVPYNAVIKRLRAGWDPMLALTTPSQRRREPSTTSEN